MIKEDKLKQAFQTTLHLPPDVDFSSLSFAKTDGWDSIGHMQLVAAIEDSYGIMLETPEVLSLSSYETAKDIVEKHIVRSSTQH